VKARPNTWLPSIAEIGAAPAGYGLGERAKLVTNTDLNNYTKGGCYAWEGSATNEPFMWGYMEVIPFSTGEGAWQIATGLMGNMLGCVAQRVCHSWGTWEPWEYVNPPMILGEEYRTTERWNGKAVYTKLVNIGTLPNTAICQTDMGIPSNSTRIIGVELSVLRNDNALLSPVMFGKEVYFISGWNGNWFYSFTTEDDKSAYTATIAIRYVKD
jgi:hypothetical protein